MSSLFKWEGPSLVDGLQTIKAIEFLVLSVQGRRYQGRLIIEDVADHGRKRTLPFEAVYEAEGRWTLSGRNVLNGIRPVSDRVFEQNPYVDQSLRLFVLGKMGEFKSRERCIPGPKPAKPEEESAPQSKAPLSAQVSLVQSGTSDIGAVGQILRVKTDCIQPWKEQPRQWFDPQKLAATADSIRQIGQKQIISVVPLTGVSGKYYLMVDGECRWRAARLAGVSEVDVRVLPPFKDPLDMHLTALVTNMNKQEHTTMEYSDAFKRQVDGGRSIQELADSAGKSVSWVRDYLSYQHLIRPLQLLLDPPTLEKDRLAKPLAKILLHYSPQIQSEVYEKVILQEKDPRLRMAKVKAFVSQYTLTVARKARELAASDHGRNLLTFVARLNGDTTVFCQLPHCAIHWLVNHRGAEEVERTIAGIESAIERLGKLKDTIRRTQQMIEGAREAPTEE